MMTLDANEKFALLVYDIPAKSKLRNPSMLLRRWGARVNLSCWVLPTRNLALLPLKEWEEHGATVEVVEFDESERDKVIALAKKSITRDVEGMRSFVEASVNEVRKRLKFATSLASGSNDRDAALKAAEKYAYTALWRAKGIADAAEEAALHFDLTGDVSSLVESLRGTVKAKSAVFFSMVESAKKNEQLNLGGQS
jgi:hypothetical protein